ncbi:uncharacterized protein LOC141683256 isoform X2 [Apium graveolens]|uniref:uncharacterized protein LOC141683256 isoform X2 n=1 Tax=Apium graveolens TaxID=4045 RepID=UPI003D7AE0F2
MDHSASEEGDLESGGTGSEDELSSESIRYNKPERNVFGRLKSDFLGFEGYDKDGNSWSNYYKSGSSGEVSYGTKDLLIDKDPEQVIERLPLLEKKLMKEKRENSIQKASKPPRPPKGPTLDILDLKLVTEISELSMKRRARIKRIKALKKMKAKIASSSSPSSSTSSSLTCSLAAIVATLFFLIVIFFQGFLSKNSSSTNFKGSPEPAAAAQDQISVRLFNSTTILLHPSGMSLQFMSRQYLKILIWISDHMKKLAELLDSSSYVK